MKTFWIKDQLASSLVSLSGLSVRRSNLDNGYEVEVSGLPKSAKTELVCGYLQHIQQNESNLEKIQLLKKYLQCAEKKDKNTKINTGIVNALKNLLYGLSLVMSSVAGFMLTMVLMGLFPVCASWLALLFIPIAAFAIYGAINTLVGIAKLGYGMISCCFRKNTTESLALLEQELMFQIFKSGLPSYEDTQDTQKNYYQPRSVDNENELPPPTYQQAMELPTQTATPSLYVSATTANFFQSGQSTSHHRQVNDNPLARCRSFY